jgi:TM2 domain-containing membrane protein YozV
MKKIIFIVLCFIGFSMTSKASSFKLNNTAVESSFEQATEISLDAVLANAALTANPSVQLSGDNSRIVAAILALIPLTGALAIHRFYLGHVKAGVIRIIISVCTLSSVGVILGFIDGIMYIVATDSEFNSNYATNTKIFQWL